MSLSLSQRAYLISNLLQTLVSNLRMLLIVNIFFLLLGWLFIYYMEMDLLPLVVIELSFVTAVIAIQYIFTSKRAYRHVKEWNEDYLDQSYVIVFDTTIPKGNNNGQKILTLAQAIFPELQSNYKVFLSPLDRSAIKSSLKRVFRRAESDTIVTVKEYSSNSYLLYAARIPDGYFVIVDFRDKVVTTEELKSLVQEVSHRFKDKYQRTFVFRLIIVAKEYDQSFLQEGVLEQRMNELGNKFPTDLVIEEKVGYSVLWVDN